MIDRYLSREELRRLLSALLVVAIFIILAAFFAFLIVPGTRAVNRPRMPLEVEPSQLDTGWLDPAEAPAAPGRIIPPVDPNTVMTATPELRTKGKELYQKTCASCHGDAGKGDGPAGRSLNPRPRDFTQAAGWKHGPRLPELYQTLEEGIKGTSMVSYNFLPKQDRMALIHHVQSLATFPHAPEDPKAVEAVAKRVGSAGETIPPRIPVSKALRILEASDPVPALRLPVSYPREALADPARVAVTLARNPAWRASDASLAKVALAGLGSNGFGPGVATYDATQWRALKSLLESATRLPGTP